MLANAGGLVNGGNGSGCAILFAVATCLAANALKFSAPKRHYATENLSCRLAVDPLGAQNSTAWRHNIYLAKF